MNLERTNHSSGAAIAFLFAVVLFVVMAIGAKHLATPPAIDADRAAVRSEALFEIRTNEDALLTTSATIDSSRGIVRLPIDVAMKLTALKWQNPSAARADLNDRAEKSVAAVKPASFE